MNVKNELFSLISNDQQGSDYYLSANDLAKKVNIKRNTASHYLNQLVRENKLIKINTRPTVFIDKKSAEKKAGHKLLNKYDSIDVLRSMYQHQDVFKSVIGSDKSLYSQIKKLKAAASYPGNLPVLINGQTGTGKSYIAKKYFEYCVGENYISANGKFISFNCAEYADNPELLTSTLFGYVKGAFTGADKDHLGLFDEANGGMLFLDEVHRLDPKGQEKLFSYLDTGMITPLGNAGKGKKVNVRLICATTESVESSFLATFIRRIPVQITMPPLNERTINEIRAFIIYFYIQHAKKINKRIRINNQIFSTLTNMKYVNNIGQLKNDVLLSVASALEKTPETDDVIIKLADLPQDILLLSSNEKGLAKSQNDLIIKPDSNIVDFLKNQQVDNYIKKTVQKIFLLYHQNDFLNFKTKAFEAINSLCDYLIFKKDDLNIGELPLKLIKNTLNHKVGYLQDDLNSDFNGNIIVAISYYFYFRQENHWQISLADSKLINKIINQMNETNYIKPVVQLVLDTISNILNLYIDEIDKLFLTIYLESVQRQRNSGLIHCILLAHGYSTASSIADTVNKLIGEPLLDSFDMPIDIKPEDIAQKVSNYIHVRHVKDGIILMADMGSLEKIPELLKAEINFPIVIFNNVSTQLALFVAEYIKSKKPIEAIIKNMNRNIFNDYRIIYPKMIKQDIIIVCCTTGLGTAVKIKDMIKESLPNKKEVDVKAYSYDSLKIEDQENAIKSKYNILTIIGTADPKYKNIPFISIDQLVNGSKLNVLKDALKEDFSSRDLYNFNDTILKNFSIERVINSLTILDTKAVIKNIGLCIRKLNKYLKTRLPNQTVMSLYVHISCMIERIIRNQSMENSPRSFHNDKNKQKRMNYVRLSLKPLEEIYNIKIPLPEIQYIYELIFDVGNK